MLRTDVKKKPPSLLLPILTLTAVAGAAVFLMFLADVFEASRKEALRAQAEQERAYAAARRAAAAKEAKPPEVRRQIRMPAITGKSVYLRRLQRRFLMDSSHWEASQKARIDSLIERRQAVRDELTAALLNPSSSEAAVSGAATALAKTIPQFRWQLESLCADLTKLTPAARAEWNACEARQWEGCSLEPKADDAGALLERERALQDGSVLTEYEARRLERVQSTLRWGDFSDERSCTIGTPFPSGRETGAAYHPNTAQVRNSPRSTPRCNPRTA